MRMSSEGLGCLGWAVADLGHPPRGWGRRAGLRPAEPRARRRGAPWPQAAAARGLPRSAGLPLPKSPAGPRAGCRRRQQCTVCQLSWELAEGEEVETSWEMHARGRTHRKRLAAPRVGPAVQAGSRDPPSGSLVHFWPWPGTDGAFDALARALALRLCSDGPRGRGLPAEGPPHGDGAGGGPPAGRAVAVPRRELALKAGSMQDQMRRCAQQAEHFEDSEALWGYVAAKFALRAGMPAASPGGEVRKGRALSEGSDAPWPAEQFSEPSPRARSTSQKA
ncbi:unnamed protein product [Prorocentrum cordatum]|uniref:U1-type domain-containing protein n=1 Tax=Prorocentrum cordatum TaxID=2364126 RepID=A0ABN9V138_9DINO|nr:unnamed protein product [Polarella glacialis]